MILALGPAGCGIIGKGPNLSEHKCPHFYNVNTNSCFNALEI